MSNGAYFSPGRAPWYRHESGHETAVGVACGDHRCGCDAPIFVADENFWANLNRLKGEFRMNRLMRFFKSGHLPDDLQAVSARCADLAEAMDQRLAESAEKTAGLRKLLEAKDCFVRAALAEREDSVEIDLG